MTDNSISVESQEYSLDVWQALVVPKNFIVFSI